MRTALARTNIQQALFAGMRSNNAVPTRSMNPQRKTSPSGEHGNDGSEDVMTKQTTIDGSMSQESSLQATVNPVVWCRTMYTTQPPHTRPTSRTMRRASKNSEHYWFAVPRFHQQSARIKRAEPAKYPEQQEPRAIRGHLWRAPSHRDVPGDPSCDLAELLRKGATSG